MVGNPDGSEGRVKTDPSAIWGVIGKLESRENGIDALLFFQNLVKALLIPSNNPDFCTGHVQSLED
ncbi:hypothetical protein RJ639_026879 [Escallonia herrerae]|uniref:Uncharacterized protein n=1 Tax=Escallonia herrerae TaxID=1293975 RepID=A0AA88X707_9ASTE|nr:hypothetical protein RJ639_026879 [Escallonia herrerae]